MRIEEASRHPDGRRFDALQSGIRVLEPTPVAAISKPTQRRIRVVHPPSPREIELVRGVLLAKGHLADATLISVLAYAGLRPGEALGLRWADVRERVLQIERAVSVGEIKDTKTGKRRAVRLLRPVAEDLALLRASVTANELDPVFPANRGGVWNDEDYRNWRTRRFDRSLQEAGVDISRPYDLRHAFVSLLISEGRSVVYVAAQAGHSPTMTLDTYGHVIEELEDGAKTSAEDAIYAARALRVPALFPQTEPEPTADPSNVHPAATDGIHPDPTPAASSETEMGAPGAAETAPTDASREIPRVPGVPAAFPRTPDTKNGK